MLNLGSTGKVSAKKQKRIIASFESMGQILSDRAGMSVIPPTQRIFC